MRVIKRDMRLPASSSGPVTSVASAASICCARHQRTPSQSISHHPTQHDSSAVLDGRHDIRRQPDTSFKAFAEIYVDNTVMSLSGHSSTRMLERYTHPTVERKRAALETFDSLATNWPQELHDEAVQEKSRPKTTFS